MKPNSHIAKNHTTLVEELQLVTNGNGKNGSHHHIHKNIDNPVLPDAFLRSADEKMQIIEKHFAEIMDVLGLDRNDDSLNETPKRVAKMFVKEIFQGLDPANKPSVSVFENTYKYGEMLVEKDIRLNSTCEHHFLPIFGKAHVAYISTGKVIGLSKINRIVDYFARRPQVQERLTVQIAEELKKVLNTPDVAVVIDAHHMCVSSRGIKDHQSMTLTSEYHGKFKDRQLREEFLSYVRS